MPDYQEVFEMPVKIRKVVVTDRKLVLEKAGNIVRDIITVNMFYMYFIGKLEMKFIVKDRELFRVLYEQKINHYIGEMEFEDYDKDFVEVDFDTFYIQIDFEKKRIYLTQILLEKKE